MFLFHLVIKGNNGPKMTLTSCPKSGMKIYDRCLKVEFATETDVALLHEKAPFNKCIYEGKFMNGSRTRVFVSSQECPISDGSKLQVCISM